MLAGGGAPRLACVDAWLMGRSSLRFDDQPRDRRTMAQRTLITLTDDIDGSEASETVVFGLDGATYEIDLNEAHAEDLREVLAPYVAGARRSGAPAGSRGGRASTSRPRSSDDVDLRPYARGRKRTASRSTPAAGSRPRLSSSTRLSTPDPGPARPARALHCGSRGSSGTGAARSGGPATVSSATAEADRGTLVT